MIEVLYVHWFMGDEGWTFEVDDDGIVGDRLSHHSRLHQIYTAADPSFTGRVTIPALWDTKRDTIVSNESSELIRMLEQRLETSRFLNGDKPLEADWRLFPTRKRRLCHP